jgi:hypothetical protein
MDHMYHLGLTKASFTYNCLSLVILDLSSVISLPCWVVWPLIYSCIIAWTTRDWELQSNCEKPTINTTNLISIKSNRRWGPSLHFFFSGLVFRARPWKI